MVRVVHCAISASLDRKAHVLHAVLFLLPDPQYQRNRDEMKKPRIVKSVLLKTTGLYMCIALSCDTHSSKCCTLYFAYSRSSSAMHCSISASTRVSSIAVGVVADDEDEGEGDEGEDEDAAAAAGSPRPQSIGRPIILVYCARN